jgi:hypothetical protein
VHVHAVCSTSHVHVHVLKICSRTVQHLASHVLRSCKEPACSPLCA